MAREIKSNAIGIGASEPFFGTGTAPADLDRFAHVPFLTNPGLIADQALEFGPDLGVRDIAFVGVIHNGAPFSLGAWTWNSVLHLSITTGVGADTSAAVLKKNGGDSPRPLEREESRLVLEESTEHRRHFVTGHLAVGSVVSLPIVFAHDVGPVSSQHRHSPFNNLQRRHRLGVVAVLLHSADSSANLAFLSILP